MKNIKFFIITGISGAGKSQAINCLEDLGFFCVDNLPVALVRRFVELTLTTQKQKMEKIALGIDIRERGFLNSIFKTIAEIKKTGIIPKIIFLDASNEVLLRRYSETRRRHPLGKNVMDGIRKERKLLEELKSQSDKIIDTSTLTISEFKEILASLIEVEKPTDMQMSLISFGYKYGLPMDSDIVIDVRFLPNPMYVKKLRLLSGIQKSVKRYVLENRITKKFLENLFDLLKFLIPNYIKEGKSYLTLAFGCTGGRHRSVAIVECLKEFLEKSEYEVKVRHRDVEKK